MLGDNDVFFKTFCLISKFCFNIDFLINKLKAKFPLPPPLLWSQQGRALNHLLQGGIVAILNLQTHVIKRYDAYLHSSQWKLLK